QFFMGLFDYECHYAKYTQGDFYKKHFDAFKGRSNRVFTTILYLNTPEKGGELVIYKPKSKQIEIIIKPTAGTLVMFESERFAHEVLPAINERYSIAGWFRKNASISGVIDPPR
ncbi:MAG: 2OG-Fe(II) oxygenase, partial [Pseudoalteromonas sp.]|nr:2OG-Fe(II) oxygenase [Pseudoalteromonas sp.]